MPILLLVIAVTSRHGNTQTAKYTLKSQQSTEDSFGGVRREERQPKAEDKALEPRVVVRHRLDLYLWRAKGKRRRDDGQPAEADDQWSAPGRKTKREAREEEKRAGPPAGTSS